MNFSKLFNSVSKKSSDPFEVIFVSHPDKKVPLGQACTFQIKDVDLTKYVLSTFVTYQNICYPKRLGDWTEQNTISYFPEAPGSYSINVEWDNGKEKGLITKSFTVTINEKYTPYPTITNISRDLKLWTPSSWEAAFFQHHESYVIEYLRSLVKPGWVIFDIGANLGVFSLFFSKFVTNTGKVYCVEANPLCVYFLRANLFMNNVTNATVFPIALSSNSSPIDFTINYGNSGLGATTASAFYQSKIGHTITVEGIGLDELINQYCLSQPNLIKIDIEGAEEYVVPAMENTIKECQPVLLIELHGEKAGINTLRFLEQFNYQYINIGTQEKYASASALISVMKDNIIQVVALPQ